MQENNGQVRPELQFPDGLVGDIAKFAMDAAYVPNYAFALVTGLATVAALTRNRFVTAKSFTPLNPCFATVGPTSSGKNSGPKIAARIMAAVDASDCVTGKVASGPALLRAVSECPDHTLLYTEDEFWALIKAANSPSMSHKSTLIAELMSIVTNANETHSGARYADKKENIDPIHHPFVLFWGQTTPERFVEQLDSLHVADGFLNRFLIVQSNKRAKPRPPKVSPFIIPEKIQKPADRLWHQTGLEGTARCVIGWQDGAYKIMEQFSTECFQQSGNNKPTSGLWPRGYENAIAVAGILAVGVDYQKPVITVEQAHWATSFVRKCIFDFEHLLETTMSSSKFDQNCKEVMRLINDPMGLCQETRFRPMAALGLAPHSWVSKRMKDLDGYAFKKVIDKLEDNGDIVIGEYKGCGCYVIKGSTAVSEMDEIKEPHYGSL